MKILKVQQFITPHTSKGHKIQPCIVNKAEILSLNLGRKTNQFCAKQISFISRLTFHKTNAIEIHTMQVEQLEVAVQFSVCSFSCAKGRLSELKFRTVGKKKKELEFSLPLGVTVLL